MPPEVSGDSPEDSVQKTGAWFSVDLHRKKILGTVIGTKQDFFLLISVEESINIWSFL